MAQRARDGLPEGDRDPAPRDRDVGPAAPHLGYQRILTFECASGGFNWWEGDDPGNAVLSAPVITMLTDARAVTHVDGPVRLLPAPDGGIDLALQHGGRAVRLRWENGDAGRGDVALLGAPLRPAGATPAAAVAAIAPALVRALAPAWRARLAPHLDRLNREHTRPDPERGVRFLLRERVAVGQPLWGRYTLAALDEACGPDGRPRARFTLAAPDARVEVAFGPPLADAPPPLFANGLGALQVVADTRRADRRRAPAHQPERALAFHLARAVPPTARWASRGAGDDAP